MNHIFPISPGITVPDGTYLSEIIGPRMLSQNNLRVNDGISVALGDLPDGTLSSIHIHPIVFHFTWVIEGTLTVMMKDAKSSAPYKIKVPTNNGVLSESGTFFQLINDSGNPCKVLYLVGPAFVFELDKQGNVVYNDAVILPFTWEELQKQDWKPPQLGDIDQIKKARIASLERLSSQK